MRTVHCTRCDQDLPVEAFRARRITPNTQNDRCKKCAAAYARAWNLAHPERAAKNKAQHSAKAKITTKKWGAKHRSHLTEYMRQWREKNRERVRKINNESRSRHRDKRVAEQLERYARMSLYMPPWADREAIRKIYQECRRLRNETGLNYHVDHIIPIKGKNVCGLHVETNLQILPATENLRKSNRVMEAAY